VIHCRIAEKDGFFSDYTATVQVVARSGSTPPTETGSDGLSAAGQIAASQYCSSFGAQTNSDGSAWIGPGDWLGFCVDFGAGVKKAKMQLLAAAGEAGVKVQMRLDDTSGQVLATFSNRALSAHGQTRRAAKVTGKHELFLEVVGGQADINWFSFVPIVTKHKHSRK
jgi:hypothetical protein